jgi:type 1 glutamine amidotransferase
MRSIRCASLLLVVAWALAAQSAWAADPPVRPGDTTGPRVALVASDDEYQTDHTFPAFAKLLSEQYGCRCTVLVGQGKNNIPGLDALKTTDVLMLFVRRRALPKEQLDAIRAYIDAGKPLVALRTSCHGFLVEPGKQQPAEMQQWPEFDHDVLGGNYHGHFKIAGAEVQVVAEKSEHPILAGVAPPQWTTHGTLYWVSPLAKDTVVLLTGTTEGQTEPVAWTHSYKGGRVFYTELGHQDDFATDQFRTMLVNAVFWVMDRPVPAAR